jgi:hypothetical protein
MKVFYFLLAIALTSVVEGGGGGVGGEGTGEGGGGTGPPVPQVTPIVPPPVCICPPAQVSTSQFNLLGRNITR